MAVFICTECGPLQDPCIHFENHVIKKELNFLHHAVLEIIHLLLRPQSATLTLDGGRMPKTVASGGTAQALFQEWSGPSGTGTVVPNEGTVTFVSDNTAVATVDPSTGAVQSVGPDGVANISGTDGKNNLTASDVFTVSTPPPPAVSATLTLQ
jgi:hypothetical protein